MIGQKILDEIIAQPMFRMECPAHPGAGCLAIWNGNVAEQIEAVIASHGDDSTNPVYGVMDPDYARFLSKARCTAKMDGYALAIHGSFTRDLDVIAVPWVEKPKAAEAFVRHITHRTGMLIHHPMQLREHGRMVWTLHFPDFGDPRFIDFSVMPTQP